MPPEAGLDFQARNDAEATIPAFRGNEAFSDGFVELTGMVKKWLYETVQFQVIKPLH